MEVIADMVLVLIPEKARARQIAFVENGDKKTAQLVTSSYCSSLCKTLVPLITICQKTTCQTGLLEGGSCDSSKGSKVLKGCGTLDSSKKKLEVEVLASLRSDIVHATDCKSPLT